MRIAITKGDKDDRLDVERDDGTKVSARFAHKGPIPHDFVHLAVESELGFERGFWGLVAAGRDPGEIQAMAKAAGHASAKRGQAVAGHFVQAVQAERAVEAFEADHWSGATGDPAGVAYMADSGCEQSLVPPLALDEDQVARIRARIENFAAQWSALPVGQALGMNWPGEGASRQ